MYGLINSALKSMINEQYSPDIWEKILVASNVPNESFMTMRSYDDKITYDLVGAASEVLAIPTDKCLELYTAATGQTYTPRTPAPKVPANAGIRGTGNYQTNSAR